MGDAVGWDCRRSLAATIAWRLPLGQPEKSNIASPSGSVRQILTSCRRFPIDRNDLGAHLTIELVGVLPHGADRLLVCTSRALDAVVTETRTVENLMETA